MIKCKPVKNGIQIATSEYLDLYREMQLKDHELLVSKAENILFGGQP